MTNGRVGREKSPSSSGGCGAAGLLVVLLIGVLAIAGCIGGDDAPRTDPVQTHKVSEAPRFILDGEEFPADKALFWQGADLEDGLVENYVTYLVSDATDEPGCPQDADWCEALELELAIPDGADTMPPGALEISIHEEPGDYFGASPLLDVYGPSGDVLGPKWNAPYSKTLLHSNPEPGTYLIVVSALNRAVTYEGVVQWESDRGFPTTDSSEGARDLLPDLVMGPPRDLKVDLESWSNYSPGTPTIPAPAREAMSAAGIRGCAPDEVTEEDARRCLRVSTAVGNLGEGPLLVKLKFEEGPDTLLGEAQYMQRIYQSDGSFRDRPASDEGLFHVNHAHLHYPHLVALQVHEYDLESGVRGKEVGDGAKTGFCLVSEGLVELGIENTSLPDFGKESNCYDPDPETGWGMGIWPQFFDMYETYRTGQYAEISGVPDGIYEFVVTADPEDTVLEMDESNNESSVVFRLDGDDVTVLGPPDEVSR